MHERSKRFHREVVVATVQQFVNADPIVDILSAASTRSIWAVKDTGARGELPEREDAMETSPPLVCICTQLSKLAAPFPWRRFPRHRETPYSE